jgi:predicted dehydrogenase
MQPLQIGLLGARDGLPYLCACRDRDDVRVVGVCDTDTEQLTSVARQFTVPLAVTDDERLLNIDGLDAVIVSTPEHTHRKFIVHALQAGLHVYCLPPVARTLDDCRRLLALAGQCPRQKVMIGHLARLHPFFLAAHELLQAGRIGDVYAVRTEMIVSGPQLEGPGGWRFDPKAATHPLLSLGHGALGLAQWLAGGTLTRVQARGMRRVLHRSPFDDTLQARFDTPDGAMVEVFLAAGAHRPADLKVDVLGTEGAISGSANLCHNACWSTADGEMVRLDLPSESEGLGPQAGLDEFLAAIKEDRPPRIGMAEGVRIVAAAIAAVESASRDGAWVDVPALS